MLQRLGEHIANARERAASAQRRGLDATDPELRLDGERVDFRSYQFVERIESFSSIDLRGLRQPKAPDAAED